MANRNIFVASICLMAFTLPATAGDDGHGGESSKSASAIPARDILGNSENLAFCYGGYRGKTRAETPSPKQLKDDLRILSALGVKLLRTYNTQQYAQAQDLLKAIRELQQEDIDFEMYVMLGAWIECDAAWTKQVNHDAENVQNNTAEVEAAVRLANAYPEIVKVIAVGNEAMVHWASSYFVRPAVILKWVNHLQGLKKSGDLPAGIWITTSDNYAAWGGADEIYHTADLVKLVKAVDYVSLHTYPFHETYHTPKFWISRESEDRLSEAQKVEAAMTRALAVAVAQYDSTAGYIKSLGVNKPIHIGETGWASSDDANYGANGSRAADEYKAGRFYNLMRTWTHNHAITCFYFEAFDEQWKDADHPRGSENHFGLINLLGEAKYALWDEVDAGRFDGLRRDGVAIEKTYDGDELMLQRSVLSVPSTADVGGLAISTTNRFRKIGEEVTEENYVLLHQSLVPNNAGDMTYPSEMLKLNVWEGTCAMERVDDAIRVSAGKGDWWGCALEIQGDGSGENLSQYEAGHLKFEIRGDTAAKFQAGFQTGLFSAGTQADYFMVFGEHEDNQVTNQWTAYSIPISALTKGRKADLSDVTGLLYFKSDGGTDGNRIEVRNVYWSKK